MSEELTEKRLTYWEAVATDLRNLKYKSTNVGVDTVLAFVHKVREQRKEIEKLRRIRDAAEDLEEANPADPYVADADCVWCKGGGYISPSPCSKGHYCGCRRLPHD